MQQLGNTGLRDQQVRHSSVSFLERSLRRVEINNSSYYAIHGQNGEVNNTGIPTTTARVVKRSVAVTDNCLVCIGPRHSSPSARSKAHRDTYKT